MPAPTTRFWFRPRYNKRNGQARFLHGTDKAFAPIRNNGCIQRPLRQLRCQLPLRRGANGTASEASGRAEAMTACFTCMRAARHGEWLPPLCKGRWVGRLRPSRWGCQIQIHARSAHNKLTAIGQGLTARLRFRQQIRHRDTGDKCIGRSSNSPLKKAGTDGAVPAFDICFAD